MGWDTKYQDHIIYQGKHFPVNNDGRNVQF